tara:strand:- start:1006 stop:1338 length:333 start_codon:yes stop_codon:yes gene_type:complete
MSVGTTQLSTDLDFMLGHYSTTLTGVVPTTMATATWAASKQSIRDGFEVLDHGREVMLDTRFHLNATATAVLPLRGWVLTDGESNFKVIDRETDAAGVLLTLDCASKYQR